MSQVKPSKRDIRAAYDLGKSMAQMSMTGDFVASQLGELIKANRMIKPEEYRELIAPSPLKGLYEHPAVMKMFTDPTSNTSDRVDGIEVLLAYIKQDRLELKSKNKELNQLNLEEGELRSKLKIANHQQDVLEKLKRWINSPMILERVDKSRLLDCVADLTKPIPEFLRENVHPLYLQREREALQFSNRFIKAEPFLVGHNWAKAFENATDFEGGDYQLPYDESVFEFRLSGRQVIAMITQDMSMTLHVSAGLDEWFHSDCIYELRGNNWLSSIEKDTFEPLVALLGPQIKAVCVALDAEVAVSDPMRGTVTRNAPQSRGIPLPFYSYHVVNLARRHRTSAVPPELRQEGTKRRLHFRRGHWRHYGSHNTWIKWMLVGNPELGFIEKEYKM